MYFHKWDFHKAQSGSRASLQTTLGMASTCISEKWASWFPQASSPTVAHSSCRAGRSSWPTWKEWSESWGQGRLFLAKGPISTWEARSSKNELHVLFQPHSKSDPKTASQILWSLQWITQVEGGPPLQGEVSRQGYPGSLGSGSWVLLKVMSFAEYFYFKELIFSDWNNFRWKTPTLLLLRILTRVLITMLILNLLIAA